MLLLQRSQKHYEIGLLYRYLGKWKEKVIRVETLEQRAELFSKEADFRVLFRSWRQWKLNTALLHKSQIMSRRIEHRIVASALTRWKARM